MLRKLVFMLLIVTLALSAGSAFGEVLRYWGNVSPDTPGSCGVINGTSYNFQAWNGSVVNMGSVVDDPQATDGKAWRINDTDPNANDMWRMYGINLDGEIGATIVARVKTVSETDGGGNIGIIHDKYASMMHWGGPSGHVQETYRPDPNPDNEYFPAFADSNYHILRLTAKGLNQGTVPPISYDFNGLADANISGQDGWTGDNNNDVSIVGGQLVVKAEDAANSGATPALRAFPMDPDENGDITFSFTVYAQDTFVDGWVYQVRMLDTNNRPMAGWQGTCTGIRARVGGVATGAIELTPGPHVCKIVYNVITNIGTYYIDDELHGTLDSDLTPQEGNRLGYIEVSTKGDDARAAGHSVVFDDFLINGAEVPNSSRTINLYIDDVLVRSITYASSVNPSISDGFMMGSAAGMQDVYFDWIIGTNEGAFAPEDDVAHFGSSLNNPVLVDSLSKVATAPIGSPVSLKDAIVTAIFMGETGNIGFAVSDPEQFAGARVISDTFVFAESIQNIDGVIDVVDGERVIRASFVEESSTPFTEPVKPVAIPNKSAAGGAMGAQPAMVDFANKISGEPAFADSFAYDDGPLAGNGGWIGDGGSAFAVENGVLKLNAYSWDYVVDDPIKVTKTVSAGDCGTGEISVKMKVKKGAAAGNFWYLRLLDTAGTQICYWMGQGSAITGRTGIFTTGLNDLTGNWDNVEIKLTGGNTATFYLNGVSIGSTQVEFDSSIGSLVLERPYHLADAGSYAYIDDIQIFPSTAVGTGLNTVGVYSTIFGQVRSVYTNDLSPWDSYFYIDDGTNYYDGTIEGSAMNVGIRCRPASNLFQIMGMPEVGQYVSVTGVMGAKKASGNVIRFFWTDTFDIVPQ